MRYHALFPSFPISSCLCFRWQQVKTVFLGLLSISVYNTFFRVRDYHFEIYTALTFQEEIPCLTYSHVSLDQLSYLLVLRYLESMRVNTICDIHHTQGQLQLFPKGIRFHCCHARAEARFFRNNRSTQCQGVLASSHQTAARLRDRFRLLRLSSSLSVM